MEDVAIKGHFADIGAHIADARLFHAAPDGLQLVRPHPNIKRHIPDALFPGHATCRPVQGPPAWAGRGLTLPGLFRRFPHLLGDRRLTSLTPKRHW